MKHQLLRLIITAGLFIGLARAEIVVVNSVGDESAVNPAVSALTASGTVTLRSAIERTNFNGGINTINFAIGGTGPFIITPSTQYPIIANSLTIDGYSQVGSQVNTLRPDVGSGGINAIIMIEIQGQNILNQFGQPLFNSSCFVTIANSCVFKGLAINQFFGTAIGIGANDALVSGCFLGTDASGTQVPVGPFKVVRGIGIQSSSARIGGVDPADRNIILGFFSCIGVTATGNGLFQIMGNLFNTDKTGTTLLNACEFNLDIGGGITSISTYIIGGSDPRGRNLISGAINGININFSNDTFIIENNYIGTDISGTKSLGNTNGIVGNFTFLAPNITISRNLISGNRADGIVLKRGNNHFTLTGNIIGLNAAANAPLGNGKDGIFLFDTRAVQIGDGTQEGANSIAGNGRDGIWVGANAFYTKIQGNLIGTNRQGKPLGNGRNGIRVGDDIEPAHSTKIGGINDGQRNVIANNGNHGIDINQQSTATKVFNNRIENNQGNGIRDTNISRQTVIKGNDIRGGQKGVVIGEDPNDLSQAAILSNAIAS